MIQLRFQSSRVSGNLIYEVIARLPDNLLGIGVDIISVQRIRDSIDEFGDGFVKKVLSVNEIEDCSGKSDFSASVSARIAAKEAFFKALGTGFTDQKSWSSIEIKADKNGKPRVKLLDSEFLISEEQIHVSLSHEKDAAVAVVLIAD